MLDSPPFLGNFTRNLEEACKISVHDYECAWFYVMHIILRLSQEIILCKQIWTEVLLGDPIYTNCFSLNFYFYILYHDSNFPTRAVYGYVACGWGL